MFTNANYKKILTAVNAFELTKGKVSIDIAVSGPTGCGKTLVIHNALKCCNYQKVDRRPKVAPTSLTICSMYVNDSYVHVPMPNVIFILETVGENMSVTPL